VSFDGRKQLTVDGKGFGDLPQVLINGGDKSLRIASSSDTSVVLAGKMKKLGLKSGDNTIQIVTSGNVSSNVFTIKV
jgi:hypothetical protein